jgi:flagellar basal body-associated protein FliL
MFLKRRKGRIMNVAIGMMIFIFLVANAGGLYFYIQSHTK